MSGPALVAMALPAMLINLGALGGWSPPARYWIPLLPPLIAALALAPVELRTRWLAALQRPSWRRALGVLGAVGLLTNLVHLTWPTLAFSMGRHWITKLG